MIDSTAPGPELPQPLRLLRQCGQSLWLDQISRELLDSGKLDDYIRHFSISGLTSNPSIFDAAIAHSDAYDEAIRTALGLDPTATAEVLFVELAIADLRRAADLLRPQFEASGGSDGWVSMEISPMLNADTHASVAAARQIHAEASRPNLLVKIPGTAAGLAAIEELTFDGIPVNTTLLFSTSQYLAAAESWLRGIERRVAAGLDPRVGSVASIFVSRWDSATASRLPDGLRNQLGIAMAQRTWRAWHELLRSPRWLRLAALGAPPQRLLWASTGTKDPRAPDTLYVDALAAPLTINTVPEQTMLAAAEHAAPRFSFDTEDAAALAVLASVTQAGIDLDALAAELQLAGTNAFVKSWQQLLARITAKRQAMTLRPA